MKLSKQKERREGVEAMLRTLINSPSGQRFTRKELMPKETGHGAWSQKLLDRMIANGMIAAEHQGRGRPSYYWRRQHEVDNQFHKCLTDPQELTRLIWPYMAPQVYDLDDEEDTGYADRFDGRGVPGGAAVVRPLGERAPEQQDVETRVRWQMKLPLDDSPARVGDSEEPISTGSEAAGPDNAALKEMVAAQLKLAMGTWQTLGQILERMSKLEDRLDALASEWGVEK